jgi:hypothetical protein
LQRCEIILEEVQQLNFPDITLRTSLSGKVVRVYDEVRRKWLVLTPEEWVRQHMIHYLRDYLGYPASLMGVEKSLNYMGMKKRSDLVVYGKNTEPLLLVECKAPEIKIEGKAFDQAARYNFHYQVPYLMISNGLSHYCCVMDFNTSSWKFLDTLPAYQDLSRPSEL